MNHKLGLRPEIPHWRGLRLHEISQCLTSSISNFDWPNVSSFGVIHSQSSRIWMYQMRTTKDLKSTTSFEI